MLGHIGEIVEATELPVNADFESGYAHEPEGVAESVRLCIETGVAGLSIEDSTGNRRNPLYEYALAVDRIKAARTSIDNAGRNVLLTARAECYLVGHSEPFRESIRRLQLYSEAGADVLYAPGVSKRDEIEAIVAAVAPKPVNVLMLAKAGMKVSDLAEMGVRRISIGSSFSRAAWTGFVRAARAVAEEGASSGFDDAISYAELNEFFRSDLKKRSG